MNNKGFMLAEVVIVSAIILTTLVVMYKGLNRVYSNYNRLSNYNNIDSIYASKTIFDYLVDSHLIENYIKNNNDCINITNNDNMLTEIASQYNAKYVYLVKKINQNSCQTMNNDYLNSYIEFLNKKISDQDSYNIMIITEIVEDNKHYFGSFKTM